MEAEKVCFICLDEIDKIKTIGDEKYVHAGCADLFADAANTIHPHEFKCQVCLKQIRKYRTPSINCKNHFIHVDCFANYIKCSRHHNKCPYCRKPLNQADIIRITHGHRAADAFILRDAVPNSNLSEDLTESDNDLPLERPVLRRQSDYENLFEEETRDNFDMIMESIRRHAQIYLG